MAPCSTVPKYDTSAVRDRNMLPRMSGSEGTNCS